MILPMRMKTVLLATAMMFAVSLSFAAGDAPATANCARPMSMGGAFTAVADDENAFFYNPAGITQRQTKLIQFFSLKASVNTQLSNFTRFISDNLNDLENFDSLSSEQQSALLEKINNKIAGSASSLFLSMPDIAYISAPLQLDGNGNSLSWGAGLFSYVNANLQFNHSIVVPSITYLGEATAVAAIPVAYKINSLEAVKLPGSLSVGANIKYIYRGKIEDTDMSVAEFENYSLPMQSGSGYGFDFGLLYSLNPRWNFGMQLADAFYTNIKYSKFTDNDDPSRSRDAYTAGIRPRFNLGAAWFPEKVYYWPGRFIETGNRLTLAADLNDIANDDETLTGSFWKKTHLGAEFKYGWMSFRAGFNSGYPTAGFGFNIIDFIQLEYAFYGEETGRFAGQNPSWNNMASVSIKIGQNGGRTGKKAAEKNTPVPDNKQKNAENPADNTNTDVQPFKIPADAKETIKTPAQITEVK